MLALVFLGLLARIREMAVLQRWAETHWDQLQEPLGFERDKPPHATTISRAIAGFMRKTSLIPIISDFLFEGPDVLLRELAHLNSSHDVFLILIDAAFAFEVPKISAGWVEAFDVETGRSRVMSRGALRQMAGHVREWQDGIERQAKDKGIDVLRLGLDQMHNVVAITEFVMERRLRKAS